MKTLKIHEVSDFSDSQFLEKIQKLIRKLLKRSANCELQMANSNPACWLLTLATLEKTKFSKLTLF